jgi:hypothetical protein
LIATTLTGVSKGALMKTTTLGPVETKFIPIDTEQADEVLNDSLGYPGFHGIAYAATACAALGYKLVTEGEIVYRDDMPAHLLTRWQEEMKKPSYERDRKKEIHHCWLKGWWCEVQQKFVTVAENQLKK